MRLPFLNKKRQAFICAVILLASGILLYRFQISPELRRVEKARSQLSLRQDLATVRAKADERRNTLIASVKQLKTEIAATRELLFTRDEAKDFLRTLSLLVRQTGNVLVNIAPENMEELSSPGEGNFMVLPVEIAINGDYSEVISFFRQLQERRQLISVSELRIATAKKPSEVNSGLKLNLYVYED